MQPFKASYKYLIAGLISFALILPATAHAQIGNVQNLVQAGKQDASLLVQEYLSPLSSGLGAGINSGWFSSGGTRNTLGFSIQLRGAVATIPTTDQSFNITNLDLQQVQIDNDENYGGNGATPTISGDNESGPPIEIEKTVTLPNGQKETFDINLPDMPQGLGLSYVPSPMIQANVGLPKNIELSGRIIPEMPLQLPVIGDKDYGDFRMFGLGAKHEINSYIPGGNMLPVSISLMAGYNNIELSSDLNLTAQPNNNTAEDPEYNGSYQNQQVTANINSFTFNVLAGKDLPLISIYGGVGYETSTMNVDISGPYPIIVPNEEYPQNSNKQKRIDTIQDPVSYSQNGKNNFHALVGGSLSILFFDVVVEATIAKYPTVNAGVGIGF